METRRRTSGDGQLFIEKIVRLRIRESRYWKEHCFGLTAERLVDKAVELNCIGGVGSENTHDIVVEFIRNEEFKYVRCLGAMYLRLVGLPEDVYKELEPLLADFRKIAVHRKDAWALTTVDQFVEELLTQSTVLELALPHLQSRQVLVSSGKLDAEVRESALRDEFEALYGVGDAGNEESGSDDEEDARKKQRLS